MGSINATKYENNSVVFGTKYSTGGISYVCFQVGNNDDDFKISEGEDDQHKNKKGEIHIYDPTSNPKKTLTFTCGRKGTEQVATWWTDRVDANQNSFDKDPGKLNFAFKGTMKMTIWLVDNNTQNVPEDRLDLVFDNFYLAQGHDGSWPSEGNNWWIAQNGGHHDGKNKLACIDNTESWKVTLLRGDNGSEHIDLVDVVRHEK